MKNLLRLAYVLFKGGGLGSLGSDSSQRKKRGRAGSLLLFAFVAIYMIAIMAASSASPNCSSRPKTFRSSGSCQTFCRESK